jgi:flagellar hook-associated protein 1 FlgK
MGSLFGSLAAAAQSMRVIERSINVTQNNVINSATPGYARQTQVVVANRFNPAQGVPGGVSAGQTLSTRNNFAEEAVRNRQGTLGYSSQKAADLAQVEQTFTIADGTGINGALGDLFSSFSQLTVSPNDVTSRQTVLDRAQTLASSINTASAGIGRSNAGLDSQAKSTVAQINTLAGRIAGLNQVLRGDIGASRDAGLDSQLNNDLEALSKIANFTAIQQQDGSVNVFLGGQTPIVFGDKQLQVNASFSNGGIQIEDSQGQDITGQIAGGSLGGLLEEKNTLFPDYNNQLNSLASSIADRVNTILKGGLDGTGAAPTTDLFTYDASQGAARTLRTNPLTTDRLAAALPGAAGGNGNALLLSNLSSSKEINGYSFSEYYGNLAAKVGGDLSGAQMGQQRQQQLLDQSNAIREQVSGVNLNEEAAHLVELQRNYQASAKLLSVLNDLTDTVMGLIK